MIESSAAEVSERAKNALQSSQIHALRDLTVEQSGNCLLISGKVTSFYQKQLAQELVRSVANEYDVVNSIQVRS